MRKPVAAVLLFLSASFSHAPLAFAGPVSYGGGDGKSIETAIVVMGAINEREGILAENYFVAKRHPGWRSESTALLQRGSRQYDANVYIAKDGSEVTLFFDVTGFFGKT